MYDAPVIDLESMQDDFEYAVGQFIAALLRIEERELDAGGLN